MDLDKLEGRLNELYSSIDKVRTQLLILQGHKSEIEYQIKLLKEDTEGIAKQEIVDVE